jgi:formate dehydrogenase subunit delta
MEAAKLARMANDIANNFAVLGKAEAISSTANHIRMFWDPRMRKQAFAMVGGVEDTFNEIARQAVEQLAAAASANG